LALDDYQGLPIARRRLLRGLDQCSQPLADAASAADDETIDDGALVGANRKRVYKMVG
jgi:hypothetical protein